MWDITDVFKMQDHLYHTVQHIISWKPPIKSAFKINIDAYQSKDRMFAIGAAVIWDAEFQWFFGIMRRIASPRMLEIKLSTLREVLLQAWGYQLADLEIDLCKEV